MFCPLNPNVVGCLTYFSLGLEASKQLAQHAHLMHVSSVRLLHTVTMCWNKLVWPLMYVWAPSLSYYTMQAKSTWRNALYTIYAYISSLDYIIKSLPRTLPVMQGWTCRWKCNQHSSSWNYNVFGSLKTATRLKNHLQMGNAPTLPPVLFSVLWTA